MADLKEKYGLLTSISLVVGVVIGIGIFFRTNTILAATNGRTDLAIIAWIIAAILVLLTGISFASLTAVYEGNGGLQLYIEKLWGRPLAYIIGFFQSFIYFPFYVAGVSLLASSFAARLLGLENNMISIIIIWITLLSSLLITNLLTTKGSILQGISTIVKVIPLIAIIILGVFFGKEVNPADYANAVNSFVPKDISPIAAIGAALIPILLTFDGFIFITTMAKEIKNSKRNLPLAIIGGIVFISFIYILFNIALLSMAPGEAYASGNFVINDVLESLFGSFANKLLSVFIIISALGFVNGGILVGFRAPKSFVDSFDFPSKETISKVNDKNIPIGSAIIYCVSIAAIVIVSSIYLLTTKEFDFIANLLTDGMVGFMWIAYSLVLFGIFLGIVNKTLDIHKCIAVISLLSAIVGTFAVFSSLANNASYSFGTVVVIIVALGFASKSESFK